VASFVLVALSSCTYNRSDLQPRPIDGGGTTMLSTSTATATSSNTTSTTPTSDDASTGVVTASSTGIATSTAVPPDASPADSGGPDISADTIALTPEASPAADSSPTQLPDAPAIVELPGACSGNVLPMSCTEIGAKNCASYRGCELVTFSLCGGTQTPCARLTTKADCETRTFNCHWNTVGTADGGGTDGAGGSDGDTGDSGIPIDATLNGETPPS